MTGLVNGDSTGAVAARYDYEPHGGRDLSATAAAASAEVPTGQFGFAGGYRSAGGMYHYGQRFYDPTSMRWTQADPLDQTGDLRQGNRYAYVGGDPVGLVDPRGTHYCTMQTCYPQYSDCYGPSGPGNASSSSPVCQKKYASRDDDWAGQLESACSVGGGADGLRFLLRRAVYLNPYVAAGCAVYSAARTLSK